MKWLKYVILGTGFGIILTKAEVISLIRIHKMFHFEEPHLFLIIGSAVITGIISIQIIKRLGLKTFNGHDVDYNPKTLNKGTAIGGFLFGMGWYITGTCPGPIYAQIGSGENRAWITLLGALLGVYLYSILKPKLPH